MKSTNNLEHRSLITTVNWLLFCVILGGVIAKYFALEGVKLPWVGMILIVILAANGIYLRRGGSSKRAAWLLLTSSYIGFAVSGYFTGAFEGPVVYLAPILPVSSMLLLGRNAGWIGFVVILISLFALLLLQYFGVTNTILLGDTGILISHYAVLSSPCLVTTWVVWDFSRKSQAFAEL
jgi:hypothetical protein